MSKIEQSLSLVAMGQHQTVITILERQQKEQKKLFETMIFRIISNLVN